MSEGSGMNASELVGAVIDALNARDPDALIALGHPDLEFHSRFAELDGRVYRRRDGFVDYFRDIDGAFANARWDLDEILGWRGDDLVLVIRTTAEGHESGVPI